MGVAPGIVISITFATIISIITIIPITNMIIKSNLKIGDVVSKWVKKKDVSKADFRKHVLEMGVVAKTEANKDHPIDVLFDSLDEDGGGTLDLDELKQLLTKLVDMAKQAQLERDQLEKSVTALRRTCSEHQQVISAAQVAKAHLILGNPKLTSWKKSA